MLDLQVHWSQAAKLWYVHSQSSHEQAWSCRKVMRQGIASSYIELNFSWLIHLVHEKHCGHMLLGLNRHFDWFNPKIWLKNPHFWCTPSISLCQRWLKVPTFHTLLFLRCVVISGRPWAKRSAAAGKCRKSIWRLWRSTGSGVFAVKPARKSRLQFECSDRGFTKRAILPDFWWFLTILCELPVDLEDNNYPICCQGRCGWVVLMFELLTILMGYDICIYIYRSKGTI